MKEINKTVEEEDFEKKEKNDFYVHECS